MRSNASSVPSSTAAPQLRRPVVAKQHRREGLAHRCLLRGDERTNGRRRSTGGLPTPKLIGSRGEHGSLEQAAERIEWKLIAQFTESYVAAWRFYVG